MSWKLLAPAAPHKVSPQAAMTASCNAAGARFRQALRIVLRPERTEPGCAWWVPGAFVSVELGEGEHAGMLRVCAPPKAGPSFRLGRSGAGTGRGVLKIVGVPGLPRFAQKPTALEIVGHDGKHLEVRLPVWVVAETAPAVPAKKPPFVGLGSSTHADVFPGRRGTSAVR